MEYAGALERDLIDVVVDVGPLRSFRTNQRINQSINQSTCVSIRIDTRLCVYTGETHAPRGQRVFRILPGALCKTHGSCGSCG